MGISDRDYVRYERRSVNPFGPGWDVIAWLICANVAVFLAQVLFARFGVTEALELDPRKVLHGQVWRLLTYDFLHDVRGIWHIVINMYVLFMAGRKLLNLYSSREFLWFYLAAGFVSGIAFLFWQLLRGHESSAIGASGGVSAVMVLYALHWPRDVWMIFGLIPVPVMVLVILAGILDLYPILAEIGMGARPDGVAHMAHLGGMLFAFLYYQGQWRLEGLFGNLQFSNLRRKMRRRPKLKLHRPSEPASNLDPRELQARVDQLLEKIHTEGEHSLTDADREVLNTASRLLRRRRGGAG
jgi:membrane associated rhomboid family serine protease